MRFNKGQLIVSWDLEENKRIFLCEVLENNKCIILADLFGPLPSKNLYGIQSIYDYDKLATQEDLNFFNWKNK